jgi:hypothetical protein
MAVQPPERAGEQLDRNQTSYLHYKSLSACQTDQKPLRESKRILEEDLPHLAEFEQRNMQAEGPFL